MTASIHSLQAAGTAKDLAIKYAPLAPGIEYGKYESDDPPMFIHVVRVDMKNKDVQLGAVQAKGRQSVIDMASGATTPERETVALINGDYFDESAGKGPWGPHIQNGEVVFTPLKRKSAFMILADGTPAIDVPKVKATATFTAGKVALDLEDINRPDKLEKAGYHLLTPRSEEQRVTLKDGVILVLEGVPPRTDRDTSCRIASMVQAGKPVSIPADGMLLCCSEQQSVKPQQMKVGAELTLKVEVTPKCRELVGGGPLMIKNGGTRIEFLKEEFSPAHLAYLNTSRHPRSAIGCTRDKRYVFLVVVEGRIERSEGMKVEELATVMLGLGCQEAMEFDGGGSATLFTGEGTSSTADTEFRPVANGLGVFRLLDSEGSGDFTTIEDTEATEEEAPPTRKKTSPTEGKGKDRIDQLIDEVLSE